MGEPNPVHPSSQGGIAGEREDVRSAAQAANVARTHDSALHVDDFESRRSIVRKRESERCSADGGIGVEAGQAQGASRYGASGNPGAVRAIRFERLDAGLEGVHACLPPASNRFRLWRALEPSPWVHLAPQRFRGLAQISAEPLLGAWRGCGRRLLSPHARKSFCRISASRSWRTPSCNRTWPSREISFWESGRVPGGPRVGASHPIGEQAGL